jgi:hypothetical protein
VSSENKFRIPEEGSLKTGLPERGVAPEGTPLDELSPIQYKYLEGRLQGMQPFAAGRYAGVSEPSMRSHTYQLERHPKVRAAAKFVIEAGVGGEVDRGTVMEGLMDAVKAAATSAELTMAWREIGKLIGAYAPDRSEVIVTDMTHDKLRTVSDRELLGLQDKGNAAPAELVESMDGEFEVLSAACEDPKKLSPAPKDD